MSTYVAILMICAVFIVGEILSKLVSYKVTGYVFAMIILIIVGGQFGLITTETFNNTLFVDVDMGSAFRLQLHASVVRFRSRVSKASGKLASLQSPQWFSLWPSVQSPDSLFWTR